MRSRIIQRLMVWLRVEAVEEPGPADELLIPGCLLKSKPQRNPGYHEASREGHENQCGERLLRIDAVGGRPPRRWLTFRSPSSTRPPSGLHAVRLSVSTAPASCPRIWRLALVARSWITMKFQSCISPTDGA